MEGVGEGLRPRRAILGGAGLDGLRQWERRKHFFLEAMRVVDRVPREDPHWLSIQFMKSQKVDRIARGFLLESFADAFMDWLKAFTMPTLVVCGAEETTMDRPKRSQRCCRKRRSRKSRGRI